MTVSEQWRSVVGWEDLYMVSDQGRLKVLTRVARRGTGVQTLPERILKLGPHRSGYGLVQLYRGATRVGTTIHVLVATAFVPNPQNLHEVNHVDGDKANNSATNLQWVTRQQNCQHAYDPGLRKSGESHAQSKLSEDQVRVIRTRKSESVTKLAREFGVSHSLIQRIWKGTAWKHVL